MSPVKEGTGIGEIRSEASQKRRTARTDVQMMSIVFAILLLIINPFPEGQQPF